MAINITIDNDSVTAGIQTLVNDQSAGVQTPLTTDTGNDSDVGITDATTGSPDSNIYDGILSGSAYSSSFLDFLNASSIFGSSTLELTDTQKAFAANVDGAVSSSSFVTVSTTAGETVNDLYFSDSSGSALAGQQVAGMQTLDGQNVYLWSNGDYAIATTSATAGQGRVVAAFYLNEAADHLTAQVQMMTFEALNHPNTNNPDDSLNFTDVMQVSAAGSLSFNFDNLPSGSFLYAAVGTSSAGVLVTGQDLNVQPAGTNKAGDIITGGSDPSDTVNTSQGGQNATIGINNQMFAASKTADGPVGVFTLVKGFTSFDGTFNGTSEGTGSNITEINYSNYIDAPSASIFISQTQGGAATFKLSLWEAGDSGTDKPPSQLTPETSYNYLGDHTTDSALHDDFAVNVATITVTHAGTTYTWGAGGSAFGTTQGGITATLDALHPNTVSFTNINALDTISFTAVNDPNNPNDGTFNRFDIQALAGSNGFDVGRIDLTQGVSVSQGVGSDLVVQDDGPTVAPTLNANATVSVDESGPSAVPALDTGAIVKGIDPDNPNPAGGNALNSATSGTAVVDGNAAFGTDGPAASGALTYALYLGSATSGLTLTDGTAISLQQVASGNIVGVVQSGTFAGKAAFAISIDSSTGVVTVEQYLSLHQNSADTNGDSNEAVQATLNSIEVTVSAKDGDGDHVTSSAVDISHQISFHDDGPSVAPTVNANASVSVDESGPSSAPTIDTGAIVKGVDPDNPNPAGGAALNAATSGSAVVSPHAAFGADGPATGGGISYALALGSVTSAPSLTDGTAVTLQQLANGNIVGVVQSGTFAGKAAFAVTINSSTGVVTVEQYLSLQQPTHDTNGDSNEAVTADLNSIGVTVTATDGDGDSKTSSAVDISHQISFHDDGPSVAPTVNANAAVSVDESGPSAVPTLDTGAIVKGVDPYNPNPAGGAALNVATSGTAVVNPHAVFGADGPATSGSLTYALALGNITSAPSLTDGSTVTLQQVASGNIVGVVQNGAYAGEAAFAVAIDSATGVVTVEQYLSLQHNSADVGTDSNEAVQAALNSIGVTVTATDGDADSITSTAVDISHQISFHDDGPSISLSALAVPTITDDESFLNINNSASYAANFTPVYGADGPATTGVTYGIAATSGANSGLVESGTGNSVFLFNENGVVVGRAGTSAAAAAGVGDIVFTASIDGTGKVTLDQRLGVVHTPNLGPNDTTTLLSADLIKITATVHDGDGDSASTPLGIGTSLIFADDAPTITAQIQGGTVAFATDSTGTVTNNLNGSVGADVNNAIQQSMTGVEQYTITSWDTPTSVYAGLNAKLSADGTTLTYYSDAADTNAVYQLSLNETANSGAGSYTFTVLQPPPNTQTHFDFTDMPSGQNLFGIIATNKADLSQGGLLVFPSDAVLDANGMYTNTSGTINTSKGGGPVTIGDGNQAFDHAGEGAYFLYVDNPSPSAVGGVTNGLTQTTADDADTIRFNGVNQAKDGSVSIVQASGKGTVASPGPAMHIFAYEANPGDVNTDTLARAEVTNPTLAAANQGTAAPEVDIVGVKIHDSTGAVIEYRTVDQSAGANNSGVLHGTDSAVGITFTLDNAGGAGTADDIYSALISNLKAGYTVEFMTATNHDLAKVTWASGSFDIGGFNISNQTNIPSQDFHFSVQVNDYDNDTYGGSSVTFANFGVHINDVIFQ